MRRFSQRNSLVTLSDINITPLLDLAFVLLIIFVITTPLLEQGLDLKLPKGGKPDRALKKEDLRTVEVSRAGNFYVLGGKRMSLNQVERELVNESRLNQNLTVFIRADEGTPYGRVFAVLDICSNRGIAVSTRSQPASR